MKLRILLLCCLATACFAQTTVNPTEIPDLLANPDIGWETFQTISPSGVTTQFTKSSDTSLPSWMPTSVSYVRPSWAEMETTNGGTFTWLDNALAAAHAAGQKLALRPGVTLRWPDGVNALPSWVMSLGATETTRDGFLVPDFNNSVFVTQYVNFIHLLGTRYDGDSRLGVVDIGGIGNAENEWHMSPFWEEYGLAMPPFSTSEQPIIDAYASDLPHHPLIGLVNAGGASTVSGTNAALGYMGTKGAGWRGDCYGDTLFAMVNPYPTYVNAASMVNSWKNGPVAFESCYDIAQWPSKGYASYRAIYNYGLAAHASLLNNKSIAPPTDSTGVSELQRFIKRLGYRFVLRQISIPASFGATTSLSMQWQNVGSAPCYARTYRVAYRFRDVSNVDHFVIGSVNPCTLMPGDLGIVPGASYLSNPVDLPLGPVTTAADSITLGSGFAPGTYSLAIGIVDQSAISTPVVRLAIAGRDSAGWYPISSVNVVAASSKPAITSLTATPSGSVVPGTPVTITWASTGGTSATLNGSPVALSGSQVVSPLVTTDYILVVSNSAGPSSQTVTVTVGAAPSGISFTATPSTIAIGGSSTLTLVSTGGLTCSIDHGVGPVGCNSSTPVSPLTSTLYTATISNSFGNPTAKALVGVSISALVGASVVNGQVVIH